MAQIIPLPRAASAMPPQMDPRQWGSKKQAARKLGVSTKTLDRWVNRGLPRFPDDPDGLWTYKGGYRVFKISHLSEFAKWSNEQRQ